MMGHPPERDMPNRSSSRNLDRCRPAVESVVHAAGPDVERERLVHEAVRANVRQSCSHLRHGSRLLERLIQEEGLQVVGADYSLDTGEVDFFDGLSR
ncbi:carbonic anhydrase [Cystobacter fuscus]